MTFGPDTLFSERAIKRGVEIAQLIREAPFVRLLACEDAATGKTTGVFLLRDWIWGQFRSVSCMGCAERATNPRPVGSHKNSAAASTLRQTQAHAFVPRICKGSPTRKIFPASDRVMRVFSAMR